MKNGFFFQLLINLLFGLLLLILGIACAVAPFTSNTFFSIKEFFVTYSWSVPLIGICLALVSISMLSWTLSLLRKGHYETVTGKVCAWVEEHLFEKAIQEFWQQQFPKDTLLSCHAAIRKNKLHLILELQGSFTEAQKQTLKQELSTYLQNSFGYIDDFALSIFIK